MRGEKRWLALVLDSSARAVCWAKEDTYEDDGDLDHFEYGSVVDVLVQVRMILDLNNPRLDKREIIELKQNTWTRENGNESGRSRSFL